MTAGHAKPLVLTGADHRYARTLYQLLCSAERLGEATRADWIVYDLGLTSSDREFLTRRFGWLTLKTFAFSSHPPHAAIERGSYAWKPLILGAHGDHAGPVFWFDSGTIIRTPLDGALQSVAEQGFWALRSQEPLYLKCDVRVMDAVGVPPEARHFREYAAGAVGFDPRQPLGNHLLRDWAAHAAIEDHIVPAGYPTFHKHDQAVLNCLLAKAAFEGRFSPTADEIDICSANPSRMISTRNFVENGCPLWADPALRIGFAAWKWGDRIYHKLRILDDTRIDGWRRQRQDHFTVWLRDLSRGRQAALPLDGGYYADPFVVQREGRTWVFVEEFVYARDQGHLTVLEVDEELNVVSAVPLELSPDLLALDCHASFPFIFDVEGRHYMIPETHERRAIDLFVCERWPSRWRLVRRLVFGIDAADSMIIHHGGRWYLITSVQGSCPNRHLEIYHASDMLSGRFRPHPVNNEFVYGDKAHGTGRNAGYLAAQPGGALIRLMQDSPNHYGEGVRPMRITALDEQQFCEESADSIDFLPGIATGFPTHHATRSGPIVAYDTRDRAG